jgi:hypothetical protein
MTQHHYVPTTVEVVSPTEFTRTTVRFQTREGVEVNLYLPSAIANELRGQLKQLLPASQPTTVREGSK